MNNHKRQFAPEGDSNAGTGKSEHPAQDLAHEAVKKRAGDPGSIAHAAGMHTQTEEGSNLADGIPKDPNNEKAGPTPDNIDGQK